MLLHQDHCAGVRGGGKGRGNECQTGGGESGQAKESTGTRKRASEVGRERAQEGKRAGDSPATFPKE